MARSIGQVYVEVEANTRGFTRETQRVAATSGTRAGNTWTERFERAAQQRMDARGIFTPLARQANISGGRSGRNWSTRFGQFVGRFSLGREFGKIAIEADKWGGSTGKRWANAFQTHLRNKRLMASAAAEMRAQVPKAAVSGYAAGRAWGQGFSRGSSRSRFLGGMDSTVRAVIIGLLTVGGPLMTLVSSLTAGFGALGAAIGVAGAALAVSFVPVIMALIPALAVVGIGISALGKNAKGLSSDVKAMVKDFKAQWETLRTEVANNLFAPLVPVAKKAFAQIGNFLKPIASAVGQLGAQLARVFSEMDVSGITKAMAPLFDSFALIGGNAFRALERFFLAAAPAADRLLGIINGLVVDFSAWLGTFEGKKALQDFLTRGLDLLKQIGAVLGPLAQAFGNVFGAAVSGPAQGLLRLLGDLATKFNDWTKSVEGQKALTTFFSSLGTAVEALRPVILGLAEGIKNMVTPAAASALIALGNALGALLPIVGKVFNALTSMGIIEVLSVGVQRLAETITKSGLLEALTAIGQIASRVLARALELLLPYIDRMLPIIVQLASTLGTALEPVLMALLAALEPLIPHFEQVVTVLGESLMAVLPDVGAAFVAVIEAFSPMIPALLELARALLPLLPGITALIKLIAQWIAVAMQLQGVFVKVAAAVVSAAAGLLRGVSTAIGGAIKWLADLVSKALSMKDRVVGFFQELPGKIGSALSSLPQKFGDVWRTITDAAGKIPGAIADAFSDLPGRLVGMLSGLGSRVVQSIKSSLPGPIANLLPFASGGIVLGPTRALIGEAGPEAVIPLTRPLAQVDPNVRAMAALIRGQGATQVVQPKAAPSRTATVNVYPVASDPEAVAYSVANRLATMVG